MKNLQLFPLNKSFFHLLLFAFLVFRWSDGYSQITFEQRSSLLNLSKKLNSSYQKSRIGVIQRADYLNIPVKYMGKSREWITLDYFDKNGYPVYVKTDNKNSIHSVSAQHIKLNGMSGLGLSGAGVNIGIWDGGAARLSHQELVGRARQVDNPNELSSHSTHVGGTIGAFGVDPAAEGFANLANLIFYDNNNNLTEMAAAAANIDDPIYVSNHSYGQIAGWETFGDSWRWYGNINEKEDWKFGAYERRAYQWDNLAFQAPYFLIIKSASNDRNDRTDAEFYEVYNPVMQSWELDNSDRNPDGGEDGFDCIPTYGTAKNILTIGAVYDLRNGYSNPNDVSMSTFSSWGPTDDGRIKPDLVANGVWLHSSVATSDEAYDYMSGTSMSAPSVSGTVALLLEHWKNSSNSVSVPRSSTMKAILIHTADECGQNPGPDYKFGWGIINAFKAANVISESSINYCSFIHETTLHSGQKIRKYIYSDGSEPIKATIVWNDPPAENINEGELNPPDRYLVNDLNLKISGIEGKKYETWVLDPDNPNFGATKGINYRDNVEQVEITNPQIGWYKIEIDHTKEQLVNDFQNLSLIISGNHDQPQYSHEISDLNLNGQQIITATDFINVGHQTNVESGGDIRLMAGNSIILQPGFSAKAGAKFIAEISLKCDEIESHNSENSLVELNPPIDLSPLSEKNQLAYEEPKIPNSLIGIINQNGKLNYDINLSVHPNPFQNQTYLEFELLEESELQVLIENSLGQIVAQPLPITKKEEGKHQISLDLTSLPKGIYYCTLLINDTRKSIKLYNM